MKVKYSNVVNINTYKLVKIMIHIYTSLLDMILHTCICK